MLLVVIGMIVGSVMTFAIIIKIGHIGYLRIDNSDPNEGPYIFLELNRSILNFINSTYVILKIKRENYISHE